VTHVKNTVLQYCQALDIGEGWTWEKSKKRYRSEPFKGVKIYIETLWSFIGGHGKSRPSVTVIAKDYTDIHKMAGLSRVNWAWHYQLPYYTRWHPFEGGILPRFQVWDSHEIVSEVDSWYHVSDIDVVMEKMIKSGMELINREFDFSSREVFMKSLVLDDDDPRLGNMQAMHNIGITRQCILRILQGDYEFVQTAFERFEGYLSHAKRDIPLILNNLDGIKAHVKKSELSVF